MTFPSIYKGNPQGMRRYQHIAYFCTLSMHSKNSRDHNYVPFRTYDTAYESLRVCLTASVTVYVLLATEKKRTTEMYTHTSKKRSKNQHFSNLLKEYSHGCHLAARECRHNVLIRKMCCKNFVGGPNPFFRLCWS